MNTNILANEHRAAWNSFAAIEPTFSLLQSWEWGEYKTELGWKAFRIAVEENGQILAGAQLLIKPVLFGLLSLAYVPRGPIGCWLDDRVAPHLLNEIHRIARAHRAIFTKIEPPLQKDPTIDARLFNHQFHHSSQTNQPRATLILDLSCDLDTILQNMRKKTRQYIRSGMRSGIVVKAGDDQDFDQFYRLVQMTGQREHFSTRNREYYQKEWQTFAGNGQYRLFMAYYQDELVAVRTAHRFGRHAAEFHAGSTAKFNHLYPNYLLAWEAICWAKSQGCLTYDLWGIPDEIAQAGDLADQPEPDLQQGLWGVYQFKRGFTKNLVCYAGAYDYIYHWPLYRLINISFKNQNTREKIAVWMESLRVYRRGIPSISSSYKKK